MLSAVSVVIALLGIIKLLFVTTMSLNENKVCAIGCAVECRICNWEIAGSNLGLGYMASRSTQPSIPPGSLNEYQMRLGRQRQV